MKMPVSLGNGYTSAICRTRYNWISMSEGDTKFMIVMVGESLESASVPISSNTLVQVLRCDFTGDGRSDMVVEQFGNVGSGGYWYGFYMQQPDGTILVTGQKFYPKEDDGRGAAWRNVWLTPDGKIVRKGEITLRGGG